MITLNKELNRHRKIILITFSTFFFFAFLIIGVLYNNFLAPFVHEFKELKCFNAIDKWYQENNLKVDYEKRWQQLLECEKNLGFFPWGKVTFSK